MSLSFDEMILSQRDAELERSHPMKRLRSAFANAGYLDVSTEVLEAVAKKANVTITVRDYDSESEQSFNDIAPAG